MTDDAAKEFVIHGITDDGKQFRPSDWAERLCGVMSHFRPEGAGMASHLGYSPFVRPVLRENVKCVVVDARLREIAPLAFKFVMDFAKDNGLKLESPPNMPE